MNLFYAWYGIFFLILTNQAFFCKGRLSSSKQIMPTQPKSQSKTVSDLNKIHRKLKDNDPARTCSIVRSIDVITIKYCSGNIWSGFAWNMYREINIFFTKIELFSCENLAEQPLLKTLSLKNDKISHFACDMNDFPQLDSVDLTGNNLYGIPHDLLEPIVDAGPFEVNLSKNRITSFSCLGIKESQITSINMSSNAIEAVPCDLSKFLSLHYLLLRHNSLQSVPCTIPKLTLLLQLDLGYNAISKISCSMNNLESLLELYLDHNKLEDVSDKLTTIKNLEVLDMSNNAITTITCGLVKMSSMKKLILSQNAVVTVSCNMSTMSKLLELDLSDNALRVVPCNISYLPELIILSLTGNGMKTGNCILTSLPKLSILDLSFNMLTSMPFDLKTMPDLSALDLTSNKLSTLPCELLMLRKLQTILLSNNVLKSVQCTSVIAPSLEVLDLSNNLIDVVPFRNSSFQSLRALRLSSNSIRELPPTYLQHFNRLISFDIQRNHLTTLHSRSFCGVQNLAEIHLDHNNITTIDSDVFNTKHLPKLNTLTLSHNNLLILDSWLPLLMQYVLVEAEFAGNNISHFTNTVGVRNISCLSVAKGLINIEDNQVTHLVDIFDGWNINVTRALGHCPVIFRVSGNPLNCDCTDYYLYQYIQKSRKVIEGAACAEPSNLKGRDPVFVSLDLFVCNITEKCPLGCICTDHPHSSTIEVICDSYTKTELPKTLPNLPNDRYSYILDLSKNSLKQITFRQYLPKVSIADFSMNEIVQVTIEALQMLSKAAEVHLDKNRLQRLPIDTSTFVLSPKTQLYLTKNNWICDCEAFKMKHWFIANSRSIPNWRQIRCQYPQKLMGERLVDVDHGTFCPSDMVLIIAILAGTATLSLTCFPLAWVFRLKFSVEVYERKSWEPIDWDETADEGKEFDVFVSYSNDDEEYIGEYLIPELEAHGFKVCFHRVHFLGGKSIIDNICECIAKSKRMLAFYSLNYTKSNFAMYEFNMAMELDAQNATIRLVAIKDTDLDIQNLQPSHTTYFRSNSYVIRDEPRFWETLVYTLPKQKLGTIVDGNEDTP